MSNELSNANHHVIIPHQENHPSSPSGYTSSHQYVDHCEVEELPYMLYQGSKLSYPFVGLRYSDPMYQSIGPPSKINFQPKIMKLPNFEAFLGIPIPSEFRDYGHRLFDTPNMAILPNLPSDRNLWKLRYTPFDHTSSIPLPPSVPGVIYHPPLKNWALQITEDSYFIYNRFDACGYVGLDYLSQTNDLMIKSIDKMHCLPRQRHSCLYNPDDCKLTTPTTNFHIVKFNSYSKSLYVQFTNRDIYELAHHNHNFCDLICLYNTENRFFYCDSGKSIYFSEQWNGFLFWNHLFEHREYTPGYYNGPPEHWRQVVYSIYHPKPTIQDVIISPNIPDNSGELILNENAYAPWAQCTYDDELNRWVQDDFEIQGLFDMFVTGRSEPGIVESVKQIGKFAKTANAAKETYDNILNLSWVQEIIQSITSLTGYFTRLYSDFKEFATNPIKYCQKLKNGFYDNLKIPSFGAYDAAKYGITFALSLYMYSKSKVVSLGLFMYAINGTLGQCMTDPRTVRNSVVVSTLCFIGLMQATQPTPACFQVQSFTSLQAMIFTAVSFITLGFAAKGCDKSQLSVINYLSKNTQSVFNLSKGTLSLMKCVEYIFEALNVALTFIFGDSIFYKAMVKMTVTSKDLQEYITYAMMTSPETLAAKLTMDVSAKDEWNKMCTLHSDFVKFFSSGKPPTETHIGYSMYSKAYSAFNKLKEEYDKIRDSLTYFRVEPFMVWLWGEPGVGKTYIRDQVINNIYRWHKKLDPTTPDIKVTGLTYVRNPADKYMSKYNGQFAVAYDDVGQNRQTDNPEFNEIMGFGSTNQVRINMADLADKGKMFSSKLVVMAANSKDVESNNLILKDEAFNRRRHIVLKIERPNTESSSLSTSKSDFSKVALIVTEPRSGGVMRRFPDAGFGDNDKTWIDFYTWLGPLYKQHVITQNEALKKKEAELKAIINDEEHPNLVDLTDVPPVAPVNITFGEFTDEINLNLDVEIQGDSWFIEDDPRDSPFVGTRPTHCDTIFKRISYMRFVNYEFDLNAGVVLDSAPYGDDDPATCPAWILFCAECRRLFGRSPTSKEIEILKSLRQPSALSEEEMTSLTDYFNSFCEYVPNWVKFCSLVGAGAALYGAWRLISSLVSGKDEELFDIQSYSLNTKAPPTTGVQVQNYSLSTKAPPSNNVQIQATSPPDLSLFYSEPPNPLTDTNKIYQKAFARFSHMITDNFSLQHINGLHVGMTAWLLPHHFVLDLEEFDVLIKQENVQPVRVTIFKKNILQIKNSDLCLVHIPQLNHGRNIINHFATRDQIAAFKNFNASVLSWQNGQTLLSHVGRATRWDIPESHEYLGATLHYAQGYNYNWTSSQGDCGALLLANDNACTSRIMGLHFGYDFRNRYAKAVILSREHLMEHINQLIPSVDRIVACEPNVEVQGCPIPETLIKDGQPIFEHFGYVKDGPVAPLKHKDLFRSPLFDTVYPHEKDLSVLNKNDSRMAEEFRGDPDILTRGVVDFAYESTPWPHLELKLSQEALFSELNKFTEVIPREVCTQDWAINGSWLNGQRLEFTEALNLKTSAGYGLSGKKLKHFKTEENKVGQHIQIKHTISNPVLQSMVDDQWNDWMNGKTHPTIWAHALKSEPIKLSKIVNGNTRTFCVAQTALLINVRRLFGAFTAAMKNSKIKSFSCLGMDSFSSDWTFLYNELRTKGQNGIDMDFFKYDRTAVTWQLARAVVEVINRWYDDDIKYQRARIIAFEDMIFSYALINKHLTRKVRGNPSGNPLTTELNNCINYMMLVMVYLLVAKEDKPECFSVSSFIENISVKTYGDDILFSVNPSCEKWFLPNKIEEIYKRYGVPVTPADKSDSGLKYQPIQKLTFLKCEFLDCKHPVFKYQAGLSKTSIRNMIQFYRLQEGNGTVQDACRVNCEDSLRFAYHWGKEFYDDHKARINQRFKELNWPSLVNSYEEHDFAYRTKLG